MRLREQQLPSPRAEKLEVSQFFQQKYHFRSCFDGMGALDDRGSQTTLHNIAQHCTIWHILFQQKW